ncbi:MAG: imidazolonepropionase [Bacteroidota bacterium]
MKTLIGPFTQLLPMSGLHIKGALKDDALTVIPNGGVLVAAGKILTVGTFKDLKQEANHVQQLDGEIIAVPGFVDAHTHICFGGSRARDYALRNSGKTYLEIAKAGGGIWDTVLKTREAPEADLSQGVVKRANEHLKRGVTTLEVKSGYGLSVKEELKMLRAIKTAGAKATPDLIPTCLAAHMPPKDQPGSPRQYLQKLIETLLPQIKAEKLTHRIDAFIEESAFSREEIAPYLKTALAMGFDLTLHADQFSTGGSEIAVKYNAISADHLEASSDKEITLLANSNTIATALPGASLGLGCDFAPARKLLDAGAALAIASDHNPGSAPMGNLLAQASILGTFQKLSNAEVLAGITCRAAAALNLKDRGVLTKGNTADITAFPTGNYQEITYNQGQLLPCAVWKNGRKVL